VGGAVFVRLWNVLTGPLMWGYDAWGHVAYVLFLDLYQSVPWADQGWSYFHPPLHYALGWALAQFGSGDVLMRGVALLASAASLATAGLAALVARVAAPERPALALVAFAAVAYLPVHLFMSGMPGNELTETFLTGAAIAAFVVNERRSSPTVLGDAVAGGLIGLALLTKFSGLLPLVAILGSLALRSLGSPGRADTLRLVLRGALVIGVALLVCGAFYVRNLQAFGNPFELSRDYPLVISVEKDQPPGSRTWSHYFKLSPRLFSDPNPLAPHLLDSVWGTVYLNVWSDLFRESDVERALEAESPAARSGGAMALAGVLPSALALAGALFALGDLRRRRRAAAYLPLLLLSALGLGAFAVFTWLVPIWSALKSSYLLSLSLPFGVFVARAVEAVQERAGRGAAAGLLAALGLVAAASAWVGTDGMLLEHRADAPATGAVRFYFGEYDESRKVYGRLIVGSGYPVAWLENLAAVELADGRAEAARRLYQRADALARAAKRPDPYRGVRLAVATALAGDLAGGIAELASIRDASSLPEVFLNRGAMRFAAGDPVGAEADLRAAVATAPEMLVAWVDLVALLEATGRADAAARARARALVHACSGIRGYPYGLGTGEVLEWGVGRRPLLRIGDDGLALALPEFYRGACRSLAAAQDETGTS
jgi:tetratricopeptide (TPR) repeat protein